LHDSRHTQHMKPDTLFAGWWNVTLGGILLVAGIVIGATQNPFAFVMVVLAVVGEVVFVRKLLAVIRARRAVAADLDQ
jgi:hypothetical protein